MSKKKSGFTLLELIIVMALTLVILGMVFQMFNTNNRIMSDVNIKSTLQTEGQAIEEKLSKIGMQASSMSCDKNDNTQVISIKSLNSSGKECEFEIKKQVRELYIIEYKNNNGKDKDKEKDKEKISEKLLTNNLEKINVLSKDDTSAQIEIILSKKKGYSDITYPVNIKFTFRNKEKE
ncbi:PilW family protein [Clostridium weizhouense]|uniref:PilW family protein n=1 Tax=Clostridium weizhouense TaxID=2859781 RepID=UPI0021561151|nr:prepilin-type N-terminal cleavage/methylation domain-containing protein [Clostridium weizhouense]